MDYEFKKDLIIKLLARDYKISEDTAKAIINDLDIEDILFEYYEDEIDRAWETQLNEWDNEDFGIPSNIHGGVQL